MKPSVTLANFNEHILLVLCECYRRYIENPVSISEHGGVILIGVVKEVKKILFCSLYL
jgi:hypothetical protein